jgi:fused signal recognition particle receptor
MDSSWLLVLAAVLLVGAVCAALVLRRRRARIATAPAAVAGSPVGGDRLRRGLVATRQRLLDQLDAVFRRAPDDTDATYPELEEALVSADVGVRTAAELVERVRGRVGGASDPERVRGALRDEIESLLATDPAPAPAARPWVVLVLGVNGVGKTTTIGKLAAMHAAAGRRVLLVAGDTFRAAAIEQLGVWAERVGADVVRQGPGANPAAVAFDGMKAALARGADVVLIDTAGRLHTRANLMEELRKVHRVVAREVPGAPHETLLVLDATTGQNAIAQARTFTDAIGITGIILTKLDGTARGGVVIAIRKETGVPIRYIGVGEAVDDLRAFDARQFTAALFDSEPARPEELNFA